MEAGLPEAGGPAFLIMLQCGLFPQIIRQGGRSMQRVTMTFDDDLMDDLDAYMRQSGHQSRSEAVRDLVRAGLLKKPEADDPSRRCVGAAVYVYDHETRELAKRILHDHHEHDELSISSLHVHLDAHSCLEVSLLRGPRHEVEHFGRHLIAERGVRYGELFIVPADAEKREKHAQDHHKIDHTH